MPKDFISKETPSVAKSRQTCTVTGPKDFSMDYPNMRINPYKEAASAVPVPEEVKDIEQDWM